MGNQQSNKGNETKKDKKIDEIDSGPIQGKEENQIKKAN
jgi:hypothetical protein